VARLAYLGTPDMAVAPLRALLGAGHEITLCVTRPDRRRSRGNAASPSPVKEAATELGLPVTDEVAELARSDAELAVVVAYGRIIPTTLLDQLPMVNLHFSLLPRWRGAAPVERAILAGDSETGVCLMKVEAGLDTGPVYATRRVRLDEDAYLPAVRAQLVDVGCTMIVEALAQGLAGLPSPKPQHGDPTMAAKITKEDLHLVWPEPARQLHRVVRLGQAWTTFRSRRLRILEADVGTPPDPGHPAAPPPGTLLGTTVTTGLGTLRLLRVQPESRGPMSADEWLRGAHSSVGERLGSD